MIRRADSRPYGYTTIDNRVLQDSRLSWAERGLVAYLLSLPDGWVVRKSHLATQSPGSTYELEKLFKKPRSWGYLELSKTRSMDGRLRGSEYIVVESPDRDDETPGFGELTGSGSPPTVEDRRPPRISSSLPITDPGRNKDLVETTTRQTQQGAASGDIVSKLT